MRSRATLSTGFRMELYIIAGPNGVGKTTFAVKFLLKYANCKNFVNADLIAQECLPFCLKLPRSARAGWWLERLGSGYFANHCVTTAS